MFVIYLSNINILVNVMKTNKSSKMKTTIEAILHQNLFLFAKIHTAMWQILHFGKLRCCILVQITKNMYL